MQRSDVPARPAATRVYCFGAFRFVPSRYLLMRDEVPIGVGQRALDVLAVLIERAGEVVTKKDLSALVWPETIVEEGNIKVQITKLRRALGDSDPDRGHIVTSHGRGYRFAAGVTVWEDDQQAEFATSLSLLLCNLPQRAGRTVGRELTVATLSLSMSRRRLLTIAGPGGIGKTTVALAVAEAVVREMGIEVCFVDLSRVAASQFVACSLACALGLTVHSGDTMQAVLANLRSRRILLVLDSCEHVIDEAAVIASQILVEAPAAILLATSREPLRITGEHVHQLTTLAVPATDTVLSCAAQALTYSAVQLFVERAAEVREDYQLRDADVRVVVEICRRLDGIPLALELAATRIDAFSVQELLRRLDDRFRLLQRGSRNAETRHRTLAAALDWSYAYLSEQEQVILRSLAVFAGAFTLDAAIAVLSNPRQDAATIIGSVSDLVAKSLVVADVSGMVVYYRLLDTTKAYALEKLDQGNERPALLYLHARYQLAQLQRATGNGKFASGDGTALDGRWLEDIRCALAWAFAAEGDIALGIDLTTAAIPIWMHLSLLDECRQAAMRALSSNDMENCAAPCKVMQLHAALGGASMHTCGPTPQAGQAWTRALDLAEQLGDTEFQLRSLWGLAMYRGYVGEFKAVLTLAERFRAIAQATADHAACASVERLIGTAMHSLGNEVAARHHLEQMLGMQSLASASAQIARFQVDQLVATRTVLANVLWTMGYLDSATRMMADALRQAREAGHALSLMSALANAACMAVRSFEDELAQHLLTELTEYLGTNANAVLDAMRRALSGVLHLRRGDPLGFQGLSGALQEMRTTGFQYRYSIYLGMLASELGAAGRQDEALECINQALSFAYALEEGWCLAELWRIKGELLARLAAASAEECFTSAQQVASSQQARLWSLRVAVSSACLWRDQGDWAESYTALRSVYDTFDQGVTSVDVVRAKHLLDGVDPQVAAKNRYRPLAENGACLNA